MHNTIHYEQTYNITVEFYHGVPKGQITYDKLTI